MKKLLVLVAAGFALKMFLDSPSGKHFQHDIQQWVDELKDQFAEAVDEARERTTDVPPKMNA